MHVVKSRSFVSVHETCRSFAGWRKGEFNASPSGRRDYTSANMEVQNVGREEPAMYVINNFQ